MLHKHYTLKLRVSFSQRKALHRPPLCDTRLQANDYNCAFFCCHSSFSKCSLALMKESRSLGTETISVDVFCLQIITDWKSHFRRNVFGNSKVKAQILPSPSCPHTLRPDIIIRQTTAGLYMQDTRAKKPRHLIWAVLLYRKSVSLTLSVGVWEFCLLDRSLAGKCREEKLASTGESGASVSMYTLAARVTPPSAGSSGCTQMWKVYSWMSAAKWAQGKLLKGQPEAFPQ